MTNYIKYSFGITVGVFLAMGILNAVSDLYLSTVSKNERVMEGIKKHYPNTYRIITERYCSD